ncbi:MAG TPA: PAS domain-containing protein, partial [Spirochaetia bacterium]
ALFPFLEKHDFPGPSKVMWSKHDEIRKLLKDVTTQPTPAKEEVEKLLAEVEGMIFKEENILYPAALERLTKAEWVQVLAACTEIGFPYLVDDALHGAIVAAEEAGGTAPAAAPGEIAMPSGRLSVEELTAMLDTLPVDITFVDADDRVKYFSQSKDRIFVRATSVIGRDVKNCHPPQSVHKVQEIVQDFRDGKRDHADFWISMKGMLVYIRYFAVRDPSGRYLGTLEVTQDITGVRQISGERRLLDE